jgi:hypothetical protein
MISDHMTRREMLVGMIAATGGSAFGALAVADGFALATDEELFVGFLVTFDHRSSPDCSYGTGLVA